MNGVCACASQATGRGGARYIRQNDELRVHLTVHEGMSLAAALKLADFTAHERKEKVSHANKQCCWEVNAVAVFYSNSHSKSIN